MIFKRPKYIAPFAAAILMLTACDHTPKEWKTPNMTALTPRLQSMFQKTKTVCFGRFVVDVPSSATVAWGDADVPLGISVYPDGVDEVKALAQKFIDELQSEKAIYHNHVSLLISADDVSHPEGKIITGYDGFEALTDLKINGYFRLHNHGVVINARPLQDMKSQVLADITSIARRLRLRSENEVPSEPGNCIEYAFLPDKQDSESQPRAELLRIGFRLKEFPDAHLSIYVAPSNPYNAEGDSLQAQWKRIFDGPMSREEKKVFANTKFFRQSPRQIHDWQTGYEVLMRSPDEESSHSHHDFQIKFTGVPHDPFKPYADIKFETGVAENAAGATKASLTDEEALAIWDKITSTIRVRPTSASPDKTAGANLPPRFPLGELAATGRTCPQTGWWQAMESGEMEGSGRQHIKAGERMPHVVSQGEPSMWQKLKGERPSYRTATVWNLVSYDDAPAPTIAQASPGNVGGKDAGGTTNGSRNDETPPPKKG
jgi:hypothetical protein